jgi:hypothetical protein
MKAIVYLDRFEEATDPTALYKSRSEDRIEIDRGTTRDKNDTLSRSIRRGKFRLTVFLERCDKDKFLIEVIQSIMNEKRRRNKTPLRSRQLTPAWLDNGELYWEPDLRGVYAEWPKEWDRYGLESFLKETLDFFRSPEIPKHFELHGDNPIEE